MGVKRSKEIEEAILQSLRDGVTITDACKAAGICRVSLFMWRKEDEALDHKIQEALKSRVQRVEDALYMSAIAGNTTAQIFFLKNKAGWKEEHLFTGKIEHGVNEVRDQDIIAVAEAIIKSIAPDIKE